MFLLFCFQMKILMVAHIDLCYVQDVHKHFKHIFHSIRTSKTLTDTTTAGHKLLCQMLTLSNLLCSHGLQCSKLFNDLQNQHKPIQLALDQFLAIALYIKKATKF